MNRRGWTYVGISAISLAGLGALAGALAVDGMAGANSQSNDTGGTTGIVESAPVGALASGSQEISVSSAAFAPDGLHTTTSDYFNLFDPATLTNTDSGRCFNAGVNLPAGAKIKSVTFFYTAGSTVLYGELNRQDLADHTSIELASFDSTVNTTPTYTSTTIAVGADKAVVAADAYGLGVCFSGSTTFSGVSIGYTG